MRFELFDGARSVGAITWERSGRIRLRARDDRLTEPFATRFRAAIAEPAPDGSVVLTPQDQASSDDFEGGVREVARALGLRTAARPAEVERDRSPRRP